MRPLALTLLLVALTIGQGYSASNNVCQNSWKFPPNCHNNCIYQLVWRFRPASDSIDFIVSSKYHQRWTGVGFSRDRSLENSDAIFAWIEGQSRYVMMDAFLPTYAAPISDREQNIFNISATVASGYISFFFTRRRNTGDSRQDLLFGDDSCVYFVYPVEGGSVDMKNRMVNTTEHAPHISETPICIGACNGQQPKPPPSQAPSLVTSTFATTSSSSTTTTTTTTPAPTTSTTTTSTTTTRAPATTTSTTTTTTSRPTTTTTSRPATSRPSTTTTTTSTTTTTTTSSRPRTSTTTTTTPAPTTLASVSSTRTPAPQSETVRPSQPNTSSRPTDTDDRSGANQDQHQQQWCVGRWSHPAGCRFQASAVDSIAYLQQPINSSVSIRPLPLELSDCSYFAQWQYLEAVDSVEFIIQTKTRRLWTGIGFSNSTKMANSDAIIGLIEELSGRHFIMDTWLKDHVMPEIDQHQNTDSEWGKRENGTTTVRFRRKRITGDQFDFQFTDESCPYFFFPTQGGSFNAISKRINRHEVVPSVSKHRICIKSCTTTTATTITTATTTTTKDEATGAPPPEKSLDPEGSSDPGSLDSDLSADLDSPSTSPSSPPASTSPASPTSPTSASSSPFNRLAFLSEPSLRWVAGIGCVATLLAVIIFQACFTALRNKKQTAVVVQPPLARINHQHSQPAPLVLRVPARYDNLSTPSITESSDQGEEEYEEEEDEDYEDDMMEPVKHQRALHHCHPQQVQHHAHMAARNSSHAWQQPQPQHHHNHHHYQSHAPPYRPAPGHHHHHMPPQQQHHHTGHAPHRGPLHGPYRPDSYFLPSQRRY